MTAFLTASGHTQTRMPQDNWYLYKTFGGTGSALGQLNNPQGLCIGPNDNIYIADTGNSRVQIFNDEGNLLGSFPSNNAYDTAISPDGFLFVAEASQNRISKYDLSGNFVSVFASLSSPKDIAIRDDGLVGVFGSSMIRLIESNGTTKANVGGGSDDSDLEFNIDGQLVCLRRAKQTWNYAARDVLFFTTYSEDGIQVADRQIVGPGYPNLTVVDGLDRGADGRLYAFCWDVFGLKIYSDHNGNPDTTLPTSAFPQAECVAVTGKGDLILIDHSDDKVYIYRNCFRTMGPLTRNATPIPKVESVAQRVNTTSLDIDYRISDRDDATVDVAALALIGGDENLNNVVPIRTLLEGTGGNIGSSIAANATHRLTWNAGADWGVDFGTVTINIFAKDSRQGLMDLHLLHMPFEGGESLVINRYPIFHSDLLNVWYWLLANGDARIALASGEIRGVGGGFDGDLLASGTNTTQRGREFLFGLMGVREATAQELTKAREAATPGVVNQWDPVLQVGPGERPKKVNEYGFDTGDYSGVEAWWVVKDTP